MSRTQLTALATMCTVATWLVLSTERRSRARRVSAVTALDLIVITIFGVTFLLVGSMLCE